MSQQPQPAQDRRPVVEFDHWSKAFADDWLNIWNDMRSKCPVSYSHAHGGFWIATRYEDVATIARDDVNYSSFNDVENDHAGGSGVIIPGNLVRSGVIEEDEPVHMEERRLINPFFGATRVRALMSWFEELTTAAIDAFIEKGECDFVRDFATVVPLKFTFHLVGLEAKSIDVYRYAFHTNMYTIAGDPEYDKVLEAFGVVRGELEEAIADRRASPREDDFITALCQGRIQGEPITDQQIVDILFAVLGGGIDTTTGLLSASLVWLGKNPKARQRLIDEPKLVVPAVEEFLRYFSPIQGLGRTVVHEQTVGGCTFAPGDKVLLSWAAANHDPEKFDRPEEVILDRFPNQHQAFGLGAHRCIGMNYARAETQVMLGELLRRLPDYEIIEDRVVPYPNIGLANGYISIPARFTPGQRINETV